MAYKFNSKEHIHELDGKPLIGTTTCISEVLAKNGLTWWASGMCAGCFGWTNPKKTKKEERLKRATDALETIKTMDAELYLELLDKGYQAHNERKELAAEDGTDLHAEVEDYIKESIAVNGGVPMLYLGENPKMGVFYRWASANVKRFVWSEMHCYSKELWLGGITDFGYITHDDELFIGDIKSSKEAYYSQFIQLALYHIQIDENGGFDKEGKPIIEFGFKLNELADYKIKGYAIFPFGGDITPTIRYASDEWKEAAIGVVKNYKLIQATK